jgi:phage FluMu protein Com
MKLRCKRCGKLLAEDVSPPWAIRCPRCKLISDSTVIIKEPEPEVPKKVLDMRKHCAEH